MEEKIVYSFKVVEVEWIDAQTSMEPMYIEDIREKLKPLKSFSVGYLVHEEKDYIVLGFLDFGNGLIKHHQVIPKKMIIKIREIKSEVKK